MGSADKMAAHGDICTGLSVPIASPAIAGLWVGWAEGAMSLIQLNNSELWVAAI
jgi:hypothetical protein